VPVVAAITSPILDNLQLIEGIELKIAGILIHGGVYTYADLANTGIEKLDPLLTSIG
jgi:predicted flap endonuclease-1-like 5' DNA nuclease